MENIRRKRRRLNTYKKKIDKVDENKFRQARKTIRTKNFGWLETNIKKQYKNKKYKRINQLKNIIIDIVDTFNSESDSSVPPEHD